MLKHPTTQLKKNNPPPHPQILYQWNNMEKSELDELFVSLMIASYDSYMEKETNMLEQQKWRW